MPFISTHRLLCAGNRDDYLELFCDGGNEGNEVVLRLSRSLIGAEISSTLCVTVDDLGQLYSAAVDLCRANK